MIEKVRPASLSVVLHDFYVDLDLVMQSADGVKASGWCERRTGGFWSSVGRFGYRVVFPGADVLEITDPYGIRGLTIADVLLSDGGLTVTGWECGSFSFALDPEMMCELEIDAQPCMLRRLGRWVAVPGS